MTCRNFGCPARGYNAEDCALDRFVAEFPHLVLEHRDNPHVCKKFREAAERMREGAGVMAADKNLHTIYGYDLDKVPNIRCLMCGDLIGQEPYIEYTILARFGTMLFIHKRCAERKEAVEQEQLALF